MKGVEAVRCSENIGLRSAPLGARPAVRNVNAISLLAVTQNQKPVFVKSSCCQRSVSVSPAATTLAITSNDPEGP